MSDQSVMTTPIFDELFREFGSDLLVDRVPEAEGKRIPEPPAEGWPEANSAGSTRLSSTDLAG